MSCKCAVPTDQWHGWECTVSGGECMFLSPKSKACAERYGEGPDAKQGVAEGISKPCKNCGNQTWGEFCDDYCVHEYNVRCNPGADVLPIFVTDPENKPHQHCHVDSCLVVIELKSQIAKMEVKIAGLMEIIIKEALGNEWY